MKPEVTLKKWKIQHSHDGQYILLGTVYGHPSIANGKEVQTSRLEKIDLVASRAETLNTIYILEKHQ